MSLATHHAHLSPYLKFEYCGIFYQKDPWFETIELKQLDKSIEPFVPQSWSNSALANNFMVQVHSPTFYL